MVEPHMHDDCALVFVLTAHEGFICSDLNMNALSFEFHK